MIKSKFMSGLMASATALSMVAGVAPMVVGAAGSTTAQDSAQVEFTKGGGPDITPVDPTDPNNPTVDKDSTTFASPSFGFGSHELDGQAHMGLTVQDNENRVDTSDAYTGSILSIRDLSGTGAGYTVTAKLEEMKTGSHVLAGADLNFKGTAYTVTAGAVSTPGNAPTFSDAQAHAGGDAVEITKAEAGKGMGVFGSDLKGTTLDVPNADYAGEYVGAITYTVTQGTVTP